MYCRNCGKEIADNAYVCPNCGVLTQAGQEDQKAASPSEDSGSKAGWGILSFFIPIVGLILFCVWRTERPQTSKTCGICALVSFLLSVVAVILYIVIAVAIFGSILQGIPSYMSMASALISA